MSGTLYLCATPIGNLEDITFRVINTLKEVDLIAAEDTRNSIHLLNHFDIKTPLTSYHEYNKVDKAYQLVEKMQQGKTKMTSYHEYNRVEKAKVLVKQLQEGKDIALITDAGTPGISDPGEELVRQCHEAGITVTALPGACALINALIISGQPTRRFCFEAFLPSDKKERKQILDSLENETRSIIIYEAPHRLVRTLEELHEVLGDRSMTLCRELTKKHESVFKSTLGEILAYHRENPPKGECVMIIEGKSFQELKEQSQEEFLKIPLSEHMNRYMDQGYSKKEAMKLVAKDRGVGKREIYQQLLEEE